MKEEEKSSSKGYAIFRGGMNTEGEGNDQFPFSIMQFNASFLESNDSISFSNTPRVALGVFLPSAICSG